MPKTRKCESCGKRTSFKGNKYVCRKCFLECCADAVAEQRDGKVAEERLERLYEEHFYQCEAH